MCVCIYIYMEENSKLTTNFITKSLQTDVTMM